MSATTDKAELHALVRGALIVLSIATSAFATAAEPVYISGLDPATRPKDAPSITSVQHSADWRSRALSGITAPIPESLNFLNDQGNWYTPFTRAGMDGRYDIRDWHSRR